jgi:integrase
LSGAIADFKQKDIGSVAASTRYGYHLQLATIEAAFSQFPSAAEIEPVDIERFIDQWNGQAHTQQAYRGLLIRLFRRAVLRGDCKYNPAREVPAIKVPKRSRYVEDDEFLQMLEHTLHPPSGRCSNGQRHALLFTLAYLTGQRPTDIRLLRKGDVGTTHIRFQPTKTASSTGAAVDVPITPAIRAVLDAASGLLVRPGVESLYVIPMRDGSPYSANTMSVAWSRVRERAGLQDILFRDLRSKALSDGEAKQGLEVAQLQQAGTHASASMTLRYLRKRPTPESPLRLEMPRKKSG